MERSTGTKHTGQSTAVSMLRFYAMAFKVGKAQVLAQLLLRGVCGLLPVLSALIWQRILSLVQGGSSQQHTASFFILLAVVGGLSVSYEYFVEVIDTLLRNRISVGLQKTIHKKAGVLPMDDYESPELADMLNRASRVFCYGEAIGYIMNITMLAQVTITIGSMGVLVWSFHPLLTVAAAILFIPALLNFGLNKKRVSTELRLSPARREADVFKRYLTGPAYMKDIRMMNAGDFFLKTWETITAHVFSEERRSNMGITLVRWLLDLVERAVVLGSYTLCVYLVLSRRIGIAEFGAVIVLVGQFFQNSTYFMRHIGGIQENALSVRSAIGYFDLPVEERNRTPPTRDLISLRNVSYRYPESTKPAIKDITLDLKSGEIIAIVGRNGSGKTTFSKLVLGLINPSGGEIYVDNEPMDKIEFASLYKPASAVFQDYVNYALSVRDNIAIADNGASPDQDKLHKKEHGYFPGNGAGRWFWRR